MMDKVQKLSSNECYTPSSEPFRMYNKCNYCVKLKGNSVTKILTTLKQQPGAVGLYEVPQKRKHKCTHPFGVVPARKVFLCRGLLLFRLTCERCKELGNP
jgi:hypothetical protein